MSTTSLHQFASSFSHFPSGAPSAGMTKSQTVGLDTLAEGSQYALEQLQLSRESASTGNGAAPLRGSISKSHDQSFYGDGDSNTSNNKTTLNHNNPANNNNAVSGFRSLSHRDPLADARSAIRKNSASAPVRRRISRACDQCNQLRTKCDGQNPCAHCIGSALSHPCCFCVAPSLVLELTND